MPELTQVICVYVDDECYGITTDCVQEVLRHANVTPVPLAPPHVAGLISLRGQIVITVSLRKLLGRPTPPLHSSTSLIIEAKQETLNVLVDRVEDVVAFPTSDLIDLEATSDRPSILKGAFKTPSRLIHVLDTNALKPC